MQQLIPNVEATFKHTIHLISFWHTILAIQNGTGRGCHQYPALDVAEKNENPIKHTWDASSELSRNAVKKI